VWIDAPAAGGPFEVTVTGSTEIKLSNVLAGEVWVCSGQSNMQFSVGQANDAKNEVAAANYPEIRLFTVPRTVAEKPQDDCGGSWQACTPDTVAAFSAVGYFFGRKLHDDLKVPIGLIHSSWGGTPAESWTSTQYLELNKDFAPILERYAKAVAVYPEAQKKFEEERQKFEETARKMKEEGRKPPRRPRNLQPPLGPNHPHAPAGLYNAMIAPIVPYGIAGAIWYQGEANAGRAYQYREIFPTMIQCWRDSWGQGDFPFLFVQLANFMAGNSDPVESEWAELREAQLMTLDMPNTGMAVTIDIGNPDDIHPRNKQDVGKRLALWALADTYGRNIECSGPLFKSMSIEHGKITLTFNHLGTGLIAQDGPLKGFAVAGAGRVFHWADARIEANKVIIDGQKDPVAVRYGWSNNPVCNLYNKEDLPASPFRTDIWPGLTVGRQ
jgi:sialate O-acetylesterase